MGKFLRCCAVAAAFSLMPVLVSEARAQRETYTGTILSYGSGINTRTVTSTFTLQINDRTSEQDVRRTLGVLQESGQDAVLREIRNRDLGYFSIGSQIGRRLNFVRETEENGRRRIFAVFERWMRFGELRGGYRSVDYPFSVIELSLDPRTGNGEGTFIAAARVRFTTGNREPTVEIENFATFPAKLMGVRQRNRNSR